ncbi:hypothetical protein RsoM2USA_292 [Ralstonia phage RsoM2USA]|nr:hypothetical protein RsoM2USA_292 [Ralstonia phage RsoM2USA]
MTADEINDVLASIVGDKFRNAATPMMLGLPATQWIKGIPITIFLMNGLISVYNTIPFREPRTFSDLFDFQDWVVTNLL